MRRLYTLLLFLLLLSFTSCLKGHEPDVVPKEEMESFTRIEGLVVLPDGSTIDVDSLKVFSPVDENKVSLGKYTVDVPGSYTSQLVLNSKGGVLMMGYIYPGMANADISSSSTAIALVMNTPAMLFLSPEGKKDMIQRIKEEEGLSFLVQAIEKSVMNNSSLFDTASVEILKGIDGIIDSPTMNERKKAGNDTDDSGVRINRAGRNFALMNNGVAHSSVVGIYKGNTRIKKVVVEGLQMAPASLKDLLGGYGGISADPVEHPFTAVGDDQFTFKIRTGLPGSGDGSSEHEEAFYENLGLFSFSVLSALMPSLSTSTCRGTVLTNIANSLNSLTDLKSTDNLAQVMYTVKGVTLSNAAGMLEGCAKNNTTFFSKMAGFFKLIEDPLARVGNTANASLLAIQWALSTPAVDTCFAAQGNLISECVSPEKIEIHNGQNQLGNYGEKLGNPLEVIVKDINGKPLKGVTVSWYVISGGGTLSTRQSFSDNNGIAKVEWTLGVLGNQEVEVMVNRTDGTLVTGAPLIFRSPTDTVWEAFSVERYYEDSHHEWYQTWVEDPFRPGHFRHIESLMIELGSDSTYEITEVIAFKHPPNNANETEHKQTNRASGGYRFEGESMVFGNKYGTMRFEVIAVIDDTVELEIYFKRGYWGPSDDGEGEGGPWFSSTLKSRSKFKIKQ